MKIEIDLKIILLILLFFLTKKIDIYIIFLLSIILHELGHLIIGLICGFKPKKIYLNLFGVSLEFYSYNSKSKIKEITTYFAGPITNLIILGIVYFMNINNIILKQEIVYTNLLLAIFNMIPILPLDGGKILREILNHYFEIKKASNIMITVSKFFLIICTLLYSVLILKMKNLAIFFIIIYLWYLFYVEYKKANLISKMYNLIENK